MEEQEKATEIVIPVCGDWYREFMEYAEQTEKMMEEQRKEEC